MDLVRRQHHHDVGRAHRIFDRCSLKPGRCHFGFCCRRAPEAHNDVNSAVVKVQRLCPALVAVTQNGDPFALQRRGIDVRVTGELHGGGLAVQLQQGQRSWQVLGFDRDRESRPIGRRLVSEPGILALGIAPR